MEVMELGGWGVGDAVGLALGLLTVTLGQQVRPIIILPQNLAGARVGHVHPITVTVEAILSGDHRAVWAARRNRRGGDHTS